MYFCVTKTAANSKGGGEGLAKLGEKSDFKKSLSLFLSLNSIFEMKNICYKEETKMLFSLCVEVNWSSVIKTKLHILKIVHF